MNSRHTYIFLVSLATSLVISSCGPQRRLAEDQQRLIKNELVFQDQHEIEKSDLREIIKQQPNRKFLGIFHLSLWVHNLPNPEKTAQKAALKREKHEARNKKRIAEGKQAKRYKQTFGEWLRDGLGDPPVVLDTIMAMQAADQMNLYLLKEGYFQNDVSAEITMLKRKRAKVTYTIYAGPEYNIREIRRDIPDPNLEYLASEYQPNSLLKTGQRFSVSRMDLERDQLLRVFKNDGYYDLNKDEIFFQVDSTIGGRQVDVILGIYPLRKPDPLNSDSLLNKNHVRYKINEVIVNRSYLTPRPGAPAIEATDTSFAGSYTIIGHPRLRVKPEIIVQNIRFEQGQFYSRERLENTHRSLGSLDIFHAVNVRFERLPSANEDEGLLNCLIQLTPAKKQQLVFETRGTHNSGFFGTAGSVTYRNRNIFRGAEVFRFRISGAFEAQQLLTGTEVAGESGSLQGQAVFNTVEFVPEISLTIPKFLFPIPVNRIAKSARPFTEISLSYGFQRRPDFTRNMLKTIFSYRWRESDFKTWIISPLEISFIKVFKSQEFQDRLDELNDLFLNASYSDHLISAFKVSYIFNNQILTRRANTFYYRGNAETSGNVLNSAMSLSGAQRDTLGSFRLFDIRYAHYLRTDHDLRYYRRFNDNSSLVFRFFGGVGVPLKNLEVLPFERSFFSGGANGIRAWQIQTLGPGSYSSVLRTFDRIGEAQLEGNIEYRQKIFNILEGALFVDAGNIWLLNENPARPGGNFQANRFLSEIAIGAGVGARLNFDFFIIRFDLALQVKDPSLAPGERWVFEPKAEYNQRVDIYNATNPSRRADYYSPRLNLNLGIGYPF